MAEKNSINSRYFSHDFKAQSDPKIDAMITDLGFESYARWWGVIEYMGEFEDGVIHLDKWTQRGLSKYMHCDSNECVRFLNLLVENYELLKRDEEKYWSESFCKRLQFRKDKYEKTRKARSDAGKKGMAKRYGKTIDDDIKINNNVITSDNNVITSDNKSNQRKEKERKEKESKVKEKERKEKGQSTDEEITQQEERKIPFKAFDIYMNTCGEISPLLKDNLLDLIQTHGDVKVCDAIAIAADRGVTSVKYIAGILQRMKEGEDTGEGNAGKRHRTTASKGDGSDVDWANEPKGWI